MKVEPFVTPKQLGDKLAELGYPKISCIGAARVLVSSMANAGFTVMPGKSVRPSEAFAFLQTNPTWRPFSRDTKARVRVKQATA